MLCLWSTFAVAQTDTLQSDSLQTVWEDTLVDPIADIVDSAYLDWLLSHPYPSPAINDLGIPKDSIPWYSDSVYHARFYRMNEESPMDFEFNKSIYSFIKLYAGRRRGLTSRMLAAGKLYFPIFEAELAKRGMPPMLKYLPIIESAMNPKARSRTGAGGLWQFMPATGKMQGLEITSYVDERSDVYKSTAAACDYLEHLHDIYDDWFMALASYNCGPGNMNKAIRRSKGATNYWDVQSYLPKETQNYVPIYSAVCYIMTYPGEHNISCGTPKYTWQEFDTIMVTQRTKFSVVADRCGIGREMLEKMNPEYLKDIIPVTTKHRPIYLPLDKIGIFLEQEDSIYHFSALNSRPVIDYSSHSEQYHIVKSGEVLGSIAAKYHVTVKQIKAWNRMDSDFIRKGKKLVIYKKGTSKPTTTTSKPKPTTTTSNATPPKGYIYYTIKKGDTLWDIAQRYKGVSVGDIKRANRGINYSKLHSGQKIKIPRL